MTGTFPDPYAIPIPLTPLVGRERDIGAIASLLQSEGIRLVTLTGAGGSGKTRLAMQLAIDLASAFSGGTVVVSLAPLRGAELVMPAIAAALGVQEASNDALFASVAAALHGTQRLLVLDNFEHVLDAAPLVGELLSRCPRLTILVTSRSPLHILGEQEYPVPPLALPGTRRSRVEDLARIPSVELFVQRAHAVDPSFELDTANAQAVADICLRLDGLPLAIELAAARVKVLSPDELLGRLSSRLRVLIGGVRDQPARLQTMRNAIDWSYGLLPPAEQALFRRLSVFAGGFTLEAAEAVAGEDDTLDLLSSLIDKSLIQQLSSIGGRRFVMLETIREYGQEQLVASGEESETRYAHASWFQSLAQRAATADLRRPVPESVPVTAVEHDNFRVALSWLRKHDPPAALELALALCPFWYVQGMLREAGYWLDLAETVDEGDPYLRARGLFTLAKLRADIGDYDHDRTIAVLHSSLELFTIAGDEQLVARCLANIALLAEKAGQDEEAFAYYDAALTRYMAMNDTVGITHMLSNLADSAWRLGDLERSEKYCLKVLENESIHPDAYDMTMAWINMAQIEVVRGHLAEAQRHVLTGIASAGEGSYKIGTVDAVAAMAAVAHAAGQHEKAARWLGAAHAGCSGFGISTVPHDGLWKRTLAATQLGLESSAFTEAYQAGAMLTVEDAAAEVQSWRLSTERASHASSVVGSSIHLSRREQEVLQLIVSGHTDRQIADTLFISPRTAQHHVASIFNKLGVNSRTAAATTAILTGLVDAPEDLRL